MNCEDNVIWKCRLTNCFLVPRRDDTGEPLGGALFLLKGEDVFANLDGYAIIPMEEYEELKRVQSEKSTECCKIEVGYSNVYEANYTEDSLNIELTGTLKIPPGYILSIHKTDRNSGK